MHTIVKKLMSFLNIYYFWMCNNNKNKYDNVISFTKKNYLTK